MTIKLIVFLGIGTVAMGVPLLILAKYYGINLWKALATTLLLTVAGTTGTYLMYYIENGSIGGLSFYGAVFFVPVLFAVISPILRVPYGKLMDLCAVGECIMLALMKVHCILGGCCLGRVLYTTAAGEIIRFPSRAAELLAALALFAVLLRWAIRNVRRGELYIWYLLLYGGSRFLLNFCRADWQVWTGRIPMGTIWSVCAMLIAVAFFALRKRGRTASAQ